MICLLALYSLPLAFFPFRRFWETPYLDYAIPTIGKQKSENWDSRVENVDIQELKELSYLNTTRETFSAQVVIWLFRAKN